MSALAVLVLLLAGCASASSTEGPPEIGDLPTIRSLDDIHLPLDHYALDNDDHLVVATALEELVSQCMADEGFAGYPVTDWSHRLGLPRHAFSGFPLVSLEDARAHGLVPGWSVRFEDDDNAHAVEPFADWGGPEVARALTGESTPDDGDLTGDDPPFDAVPPTGGGCMAEGRRRLFGLVGHEPMSTLWFDQLVGATIMRAYEDPRLRGPEQAWSACMKQRGYEYGATHEIPEDPRWVDDPESARDVAVAQVECTHSSRLVDTWVALAAAYQERAVEENAERLRDHRDTRQAILRAVRERGLGDVGPHPAGRAP